MYVVKENASITALSTLFLAGITVWLGIIAAGQHSTVRAQLRAYVGVPSGKIMVVPDPAKLVVTVNVRMKNFGQTPAHEVQCWAAVVTAQTFSAKFNSHQTLIGAKISLFPQDAQTVKFSHELSVLPGTDPIGIFIFGHIIYRDVFGNPWRTNFRFTGDLETGSLASCEEGNEAT